MSIDITELSRDYSKEPLSSKEIIKKEDLVELYINQNLTTRDLMKLFSVSSDRIIYWLKYYNIKKSKEDINKRISQTLKSEETKQKARLSNLQNCGYENPAQNPVNTAKSKETRKQRYGDENFNNRVQTEQTCQKKYGYSHVMKVPEIRKKVDETCIIKYGNKCSAQGEEQRKQADSKNEKIYGAKNVFASTIIKEKIKQIMCTPEAKQRKSQIMSSVEVQVKINKSKKEHNSFIKSYDEEYVWSKLKSKFGEVKRQYRSEKYPFNCDFYIPSKDLYIEYNGTWLHGLHPFDIKNTDDLQKGLLWLEKAKEVNFKNKNKQYYINAYKVWTKTDVRKRETAKNNKLNYLEFFNIEQFNNWLKQQNAQ